MRVSWLDTTSATFLSDGVKFYSTQLPFYFQFSYDFTLVPDFPGGYTILRQISAKSYLISKIILFKSCSLLSQTIVYTTPTHLVHRSCMTGISLDLVHNHGLCSWYWVSEWRMIMSVNFSNEQSFPKENQAQLSATVGNSDCGWVFFVSSTELKLKLWSDLLSPARWLGNDVINWMLKVGWIKLTRDLYQVYQMM